MSSPEIRVLADLEALSRSAAELVQQLARQSVSERGQFSLALAGGATPRRLYEILADEPFLSEMPWPKIHLFWGDERCVEPEHLYSNFRLAREVLLDRLDLPPANVHRPPAELGPQAAAQAYERDLARFFGRGGLPEFDLILLGLGPDGHVLSLFPGHPALWGRRRWVVGVDAPQARPAVDRISLTLPVINRARTVAFLAAGAEKTEVVGQILAGQAADHGYPAALISPARLIWFLDQAAAGQAR